MLTLAALVACASLATHAPSTPHAIGAIGARDALLAEPAPKPPHRTSTHSDRWHRNTFVSVTHASTVQYGGAQRLHSPTARYGADPARAGARPLARINHQSLAIDPWTPVEGRGALARLEDSRNQWLREQGYVEKVRTHTNPTPFDPRFEQSSRDLPEPRGILEVAPVKPGRLRVDATPR